MLAGENDTLTRTSLYSLKNQVRHLQILAEWKCFLGIIYRLGYGILRNLFDIVYGDM